MAEIVIRPVTIGDIAGFNACVGAVMRERHYLAFTEPFTLEQSATFVGGILTRGDVQLVAVDGETIVGWCDVRRETIPVYVHEGLLGMGVLDAQRGRGLGERLIRATLDAAWRAGFERVSLSVYGKNERAAALYRKVGFVLEGRRVRGKKLDGEYDDVLMMAMFAPDGPRS